MLNKLKKNKKKCKEYRMLKYLLLSLLSIASAYDRDYLLECWNEYHDNEKIDLCVRWRHYETLWRECQFGNNFD